MVDQGGHDEELTEFLGPLEREIMAILWDAGEPQPVAAVLDVVNEERARPLAYTTVMSVMVRLVRKQLLERRKNGRAYRYRPTTDRTGAIRQEAATRIRAVLNDHGEMAVAGFIDEVSRSPELLAVLQGILDDGQG